MSTPIWDVVTWPVVWVESKDRHSLAGEVYHISTVTIGKAGERGIWGQILFGVESAERLLGLAWDWIALSPGVIALADPMMVLSNVHFRDSDGEPVQAALRVLELNSIIHRIDWQPTVHNRLLSAPSIHSF